MCTSSGYICLSNPFPTGTHRPDRLFDEVTGALDRLSDVDLTAELITHRFTPKSKEILIGWYPGGKFEMDEAVRSRKTTKFGSEKWVFPKDQMTEMRMTLEASLARGLPMARILYWT